MLNRDTPWFDYETWALETSSSKSTSFTWDHTYDGLNWPRDGRELLRVRARQPAYWKAENLDDFDGARVAALAGQLRRRRSSRTNPARRASAGRSSIQVSIRNLRTDQFITAGYAIDVDIPRLSVVPTLDGLYVPPRTLRRGDTYTARVYTPRPTREPAPRARAPTTTSTWPTTRRSAPPTLGVPGADHVRMTFPFFGAETRRRSATARRATDRRSRCCARAGLYAHLRARAAARRGRAHARGLRPARARPPGRATTFTYSETPPPESRTLDGFLFDAKQGYCQQFSGAMALLLRMAGIPARVVTGFSTGATDTKTGEYIVRDFDAHSWVEVYYPGWGWITFDPTPAASPARSQPADAASVPGSSSGVGAVASAATRSPSAAPASRSRASRAPWWR